VSNRNKQFVTYLSPQSCTDNDCGATDDQIRFRLLENKLVNMIGMRLQLYLRRNDRAILRAAHRRTLTTSNSNLQVMIFGSSTDVGKTVVAAGICRAALSRSRKVCYIKPVQTGELDEYFVSLYTNPQGICDMFLRTLHHWSSSISPHLASRINANEGPISDADLVAGLRREIRAFSGSDEVPGSHGRFTVVETAGGVLSPGPSKTLQADIYRSLRLPIILVGDSKLGGITTTLSAYESLRLRGYTVHAIVMIEHPGTNKYGNVVMIREHLERSLSSSPVTGDNGDYGTTPKWAVNSVPKVFRMFPLPSEKLLHNWFKENSDQFGALFDHLASSVEEDTRRLMAMRRDGQSAVWWPFTQHATVGDGDVTFIESAHGDQFRVVTPETRTAAGRMLPVTEADDSGFSNHFSMTSANKSTEVNVTDLFDGCGSWWTQVLLPECSGILLHSQLSLIGYFLMYSTQFNLIQFKGVGHGNPSMSMALAEAAGRYGHVMFPSNLHPPAVQLAQYLLEKGPGKGWANRVFYSGAHF
jgi:bifunctional dethiobiotin synthetase / adenosylmethionine---8-amino-7-oxononanoate aminotransferase